MPNTCKCGRSPSGVCNGWHKLSHPEFLRKLREQEIKDLKKESDQKLANKND